LRRLRIIVDVKVEAREEVVEKLGENWYLVRVRATRQKGKANVAILRLLRKYFGEDAHIVSGFSSTRKVVEIGP